ncbi:MAG: ATP-binding cassette domain-containing protein [Alphaproteobacteria bacterium]|nr:ATP-binding cassette domain-containing protein [Alphaproteobacteria bacterium]
MSGELVSPLVLEGIGKRFSATVEIGPVDLEIAPGEIVAIVGASGIGKSTLLRIAAGLVAPDAGTVLIDGAVATEPGPDRVYLAQDAGLFPWLTVADNVGFGLAGPAARDKTAMVQHWLERVELPSAGAMFPHQLSGGMRQRVALARALAVAPPILLLDEPFAAIDTRTRQRMQSLVLDLWSEAKPAILMVTHDVEEAVLMANRVLVLRGHPARFAETIPVDRTSHTIDQLRLSDATVTNRRRVEAALAG